ncbi:MAG: hypothetical protein MJA84_03655 [Firmicutes bacterium]|nr:hypothetical protein [Bacillota bacterium]
MIIVLAIGLLFIGFGIAQALFKFEVDKKVIDQVSFILMLAAAFLIFSGRKKKNRQEEGCNHSKAEETAPAPEQLSGPETADISKPEEPPDEDK